MWKSTLSRAEPQRYAQVISLVSSGRAAFADRDRLLARRHGMVASLGTAR